MKTKLEMMMMTALAAIAVAGCSKNGIPEEPESPYMDLVLVSENPTTKTQMNDAGDDIVWSSDEILNFYADEKPIPGMNVSSVQEDGKLKVTLKHIPSGTSVIDGFAGAEMKADAQIIEDGKVKAYGIKLPQEQEITLSSYDPKADALVMRTQSLDGLNRKEPVVNVTWNRLNAVTKLAFTGWTEDFSNDIVSTIEVSTTNTALAGCFTYDFANKKFLAGPAVFNAGAASNSILMKFTDTPSLNADFAAWMITAATELPAGETITLTIETGRHTIVKSINVEEAVRLVNTKLNELSLNMADAKITGKRPKPVWTETFDDAKDDTPFADDRWIVTDYHGWGRFCWGWVKDQLGENGELIKSHNAILIHYYGTVWHLDAFVMIKEPFDISVLPMKEFCYTWGAGNTEIQTPGTDTSYERKYDFAKFEVVASTDFVDDPFRATWTVLHDGTTTVAPEGYQYPDANEETVSLAPLANEKKVYLGFRYTGGNAAYRIDNVNVY